MSGRHRYTPRGKRQRLTFRGVLIGCTDTAFACGVDGATLGGVKVSEAEVRKLSNETNPDPASPGLNLIQLRDVAHKLRIDFAPLTGFTWQQLNDALDQNALVVAQLWAADIGGPSIGHAVLAQQIRTPNKMRIMDPLKGRWETVQADDVRAGMVRFARMTGVDNGLRWGSFRRAPWMSDDQAPQRG